MGSESTEIKKALTLVDQGDHESALQCLESLARGGSAAARFYKGLILRKLDDTARAVEVFRSLSREYVSNELASLGLFHSLLNEGAVGLAFEEMKRFLADFDSASYLEILNGFLTDNDRLYVERDDFLMDPQVLSTLIDGIRDLCVSNPELLDDLKIRGDTLGKV
ncbi:MAG: tetratricopeptide repeat protein [Pseudomonadota bacterium]